MHTAHEVSRRGFLHLAATAGAGLVVSGCAQTDALHPGDRPGGQDQAEVTASEDLMREHGVLSRTLLVYEESLRRLEARQELPPTVLADAADIVRRFIEDYHEKNEEDFIFPRFEKAGKLADLTSLLRAQHAAGRQLTATIQQLALPEQIKQRPYLPRLRVPVEAFIRLYRPHKAREDTVLFPALRQIMSAKEYDDLGDKLEARERDLFHGEGFEQYVDKVAALEKVLGIYDLRQFTPQPAAGG